MSHPSPPPELIAALRAIVGETGLLTDAADMARYCEDWRHLYRRQALAVVRPGRTPEVAAVVRLCAGHGIPIVPQGGNTSMVGGAVPGPDGNALILSLERMRAIRAIDPVDLTLTAEAGLTLAAAQQAAAASGALLPLSIASEGTAQLGGVIATNAGGNATLRYGNARDLVLGLEVVLPDGSVWNGLRRLHKDNTGYCLRQLFAGSEGTLGIITAAVLRLVPRPREVATGFCALPSPEAALALLTRLQHEDPASLAAFEYMSGPGVDLVLRHIPDTTLPLATRAPHYALVELASPRRQAGLAALLESVLGEALEAQEIVDAAIAASEAQRAGLWRLREEHSEAQKREGASVKNDVSVPVSRVADLIRGATEACVRLIPGIRAMPFGHIGDGNIHFNLLAPDGADPDAFLARDHAIMDAVGGVVRSLDGSFSAEHGVGQLKSYMMPLWRGGAELATMRAIKRALDPHGIMNPGKVLPADEPAPES